jgi:preprotein translocase subunit YajC
MTTSIIFFAGMLALLWLLIIAPQRRRRQQQAQMLGQLAAGDEVITAGGVYGSVREVADDHVLLEIAPGTRVRVLKSAVAARVEPAPEHAASPETPLT